MWQLSSVDEVLSAASDLQRLSVKAERNLSKTEHAIPEASGKGGFRWNT